MYVLHQIQSYCKSVQEEVYCQHSSYESGITTVPNNPCSHFPYFHIFLILKVKRFSSVSAAPPGNVLSTSQINANGK